LDHKRSLTECAVFDCALGETQTRREDTEDF
jgi:hypothetical protein